MRSCRLPDRSACAPRAAPLCSRSPATGSKDVEQSAIASGRRRHTASLAMRLAFSVALVLVVGGTVVALAAFAYGRQAAQQAFDRLLIGAADADRRLDQHPGRPRSRRHPGLRLRAAGARTRRPAALRCPRSCRGPFRPRCPQGPSPRRARKADLGRSGSLPLDHSPSIECEPNSPQFDASQVGLEPPLDLRGHAPFDISRTCRGRARNLRSSADGNAARRPPVSCHPPDPRS